VSWVINWVIKFSRFNLMKWACICSHHQVESVEQKRWRRWLANNRGYYCVLFLAVRYPESWYNDITSSSRFYSLAATINSSIIGIIISEMKPRSRCNREVRTIIKWGLLMLPQLNWTELVMVALWNRTDHYIFILWFLSSIYLSIFFFCLA